MAIDLDALNHAVTDQLGRDRAERRRRKQIVAVHTRLKAQGQDTFPLLLDLEQLYSARLDHAVDIALGIGVRAGRADAQAADLDDETAALVRHLALVGLNLPKLRRLQAIAELLKLDLADDLVDVD